VLQHISIAQGKNTAQWENANSMHAPVTDI